MRWDRKSLQRVLVQHCGRRIKTACGRNCHRAVHHYDKGRGLMVTKDQRGAGAIWLTRKREVEKKKRGQTKPSEEKMVGKNGRFER